MAYWVKHDKYYIKKEKNNKVFKNVNIRNSTLYLLD